jgi:hypothetical protein
VTGGVSRASLCHFDNNLTYESGKVPIWKQLREDY